ncbi:MAG: hypothetical protein QNJ98_04585 [Planctomycetota bacterium]|nr:hypothetical protein [Planctomycetota bacterium]
MRTTFLLALALLLVGASSLFAAPVTDAERDAIRREVLRRVRIEPERIEHAALKQVFDAAFFKAEVHVDQGGGSSTSSTIQLSRQGEKWVEVENPTTDQGLPVLTSLVKDTFRLDGKEAAEVFEQALDQLFPMRSFGNKKEPKEILRKGSTWIFVRGTFFEDKKGFTVATDEEGKITEIRQQLRLPKN